MGMLGTHHAAYSLTGPSQLRMCTVQADQAFGAAESQRSVDPRSIERWSCSRLARDLQHVHVLGYDEITQMFSISTS